MGGNLGNVSMTMVVVKQAVSGERPAGSRQPCDRWLFPVCAGIASGQWDIAHATEPTGAGALALQQHSPCAPGYERR